VQEFDKELLGMLVERIQVVNLVQKKIRRIGFVLCIILLVICIGFNASVVLAADVVVLAEPGVSEVLDNEYRAITGKVMQFYQKIYSFVPTTSIKVLVVSDELSYAQVLQREGASQEQALRTAKSSRGISLGLKPVIVICADKNSNYLSRIRIVTHEMFHQMQGTLEGNVPAHNWLKEGSAELSEFVLLEWLGEGSMAANRQNLVNFLVNTKPKAEPYDMNDNGTKWTSLVERKMYPYQVSELMTDYLMRQVGTISIVKYFVYIKENGNRDTAFQKAFGMSHDQFIQNYQAYMMQEQVAIGKVNFEVEGGVSSQTAQRIRENGAIVEQLLRGQNWKLSMSQRVILVPNQDIMLKVMRRELPQMKEDKLSERSQRLMIAPVGGMNFVFDTGKAIDSDKSFSNLALTISRNSVVMTARPALAMNVYWIYEGTVRILAAKAEEAAGEKKFADSRQEWIATIQKAGGYPTVTQMNSSLTSAFNHYGEDVSYATTALASEYLISKSPLSLVHYFTVLRDFNDGRRAFQQVFGMTIEAFNSKFEVYLNGLITNNL